MKIKEFKIKSLNGYNISVRTYVPTGNIKEIIIAVHGFGGDKDSSAIRLLAEKMVKENFLVICFDFPSHGDSEVEADKLTIDNCMNDIETIEQYIKVEFGRDIKINIFATSFGAYITLLKIIKKKTRYNKIVLRASAIKMDEILKNTLLREPFEDFKRTRVTKLGFRRIMNIPYDFYEELKKIKY